MTGSVQLKNGKWWVSLNIIDTTGQRVKQLWFNTLLPQRGNKKRATEILNELSILDPCEYTEKFITEIKFCLKINVEKIADKDISITNLLRNCIYEFKKNMKRGVNPIHESEAMFCDFVKLYIAGKKEFVAAYTAWVYDKMYERHILPFFGSLEIKIKEFEPKHMQDFISYLRKKGLSDNTIRKYFTLVRSSLALAIKKRVILDNPTDDVMKPKLKKFTAEFYCKDEINQLIDVAKGTKLETVVMIACYFGLRRSEIIGLKWDAVDFHTDMITVKNKVLMIQDEAIGKRIPIAYSELKSESSRRSLPMGEAIKNYLLQVRARQEANAQYFGNSYNTQWDGYVCRHDDGTLVLPEYIRTMFPRLLKRNGMKTIRFHDLRHSCATLLLQSGFNMREVQEWMGHSDFSITAKTYAHVDHKNKASMAYSLDDQIAVVGKKEQKTVLPQGDVKDIERIASSMIKAGIDIEKVVDITGISKKDIVFLAYQMGK